MIINYRSANISDLEQLVQLRILMQLEVNGLSKDKVTDDYVQKVRTYFQNTIETKKYFSAIATDGDKIVGTAGVCFYEKPPSISTGSGLVGYVTNVYTLPFYRKKGVGTTLMRKLNQIASELNAHKLHLGATLDGLSIYKAVGYEEPRFVNLEIKLVTPI